MQQNTYDKIGNLIEAIDELGRSTKTDYDVQGLPTVRYDAYGKVVEKNTYNEVGQLILTEDALGNQNQTVYDEFGRLTAVLNELNQKTIFKYNVLDQLVEVKDPIEGLAKQTFDHKGKVTSVTDTNGNTATYAYDLLGQLVQENMAIGGVKTYTYDSIGLLERMKNARNQETEYTYDDSNRITKVTDEVGTIAYTYDANGNILTVTDEKGTATRTFDALDRMTSYTDHRGNTVKYSYDSVGNLIALTYPGGKIVRYTYDAENQLTAVTDWSKRVTKYEYDLNGRQTKTTRPNGTVKTVIYDAAGQVTSSKDVDSKGKIIVSYEYTYNKKGQITEEKSSIKSFGENVQKTVMTYTNGNQLDSFNGQKVKFDADGNMTYGPLNGKMTTYEYDARNRLIKVGDTTYEYDAENHRIASTTGTLKTEYLIDPSGALTDVIGIKTGKDITLFINGNGLIAQEDSKGNYHSYHYDYRGSTIALTDRSGKTTDQMVYGTYGELLKRTGTTKTPFLYNGRDGIMTDANGLYYMRARFYNPELKRFVNQDVLTGSISDSGSLNRFSYVTGDPVGKIDPSGMRPDEGGPSGTAKPADLKKKVGDNLYLFPNKHLYVLNNGKYLLVARNINSDAKLEKIKFAMRNTKSTSDLEAGNRYAYYLRNNYNNPNHLLYFEWLAENTKYNRTKSEYTSVRVNQSMTIASTAMMGYMLYYDVKGSTQRGGNVTSKSEPQSFLQKALKNQGINSVPSKMKEVWTEGNFKYTVRVHEGNPTYTNAESIYRVSRQSTVLDVKGQGTGLQYLGTDGNWYAESILKEFFKDGMKNPLFNEAASKMTHIPVNGGK